jgi:hypothetical protein
MKNPCMHQVRRSCMLYRACSLAVIAPTPPNGKIKKVLTDHLVHLVLAWVFSTGCYDPDHDFKEQESSVYDFILQHPVPEGMMYPLQYVRYNLSCILYLRKKKNCNRMREHRKGIHGKNNSQTEKKQTVNPVI